MQKKLVKIAGSYAFLEGLHKGAFFLLTPLFTKYISPAEYGNVSIFLMALTLLKILFSFSLEAAITRFYSRFKDYERYKLLLGNIFIFIIFVFILYVIIILSIGKYLYISHTIDEKIFHLLLILLAVSVFYTLNNIYFTILKTLQDIRKFFIFYNIYFILQTGMIFYFIVISTFHPKDYAYTIALAISNILFLVIIFHQLNKHMIFIYKKRLLKVALAYSITFIPVQLINIFNTTIDRYILLFWISSSAVGIYFLGYQIGTIISLILLAINTAFVPIFFKLYDNKDFHTIQNIISYLVFFSAILFLITLYSIPYLFTMFFPKNYQETLTVIPILLFKNALMVLYFINTNFLAINRQLNIYKIYVVLIGLISNVIISILFVQQYKLTAVAYGTLGGYIVIILLLSTLVKRNFTIKIYTNIYLLLFFSLYLINYIVTTTDINTIYGFLFSIILISCYWYFTHNYLLMKQEVSK